MKKIRFVMMMSLLILFIPTVTINAQGPSNSIISEPTMRSDIIEWRYKFEDGKFYRRLFNYSKNEWVGDWELCPQ